jgi:hypothetical protein
MRRLLALLLLLQAFHGTWVQAKDRLLEVVVTAPFLEMHSGPGRGFPVVYVVGRDEVVTVLYSRTEWYKVRAPQGQEGWARRSDLALTKLAIGRTGADPALPAVRHPSLGTGRRLRGVQSPEPGHHLGRFRAHRQPRRGVRRAAGARHHRQPLHRQFGNAPHLHPGVALVFADGGHRRRATSISTTRSRPSRCRPATIMVYVSLGARGFITRRFMWRADWRKYVVFTNQNQNEEPEEWKFGLAVFF